MAAEVSTPAFDDVHDTKPASSGSATVSELSELTEVNDVQELLTEETFSDTVPRFTSHTTEAGGPQSMGQAKIESHTDDPARNRFPRISRPVEILRTSYDVVVIGSGYGGAVAASRMARGGQSVCLLERGKEKWPGEYPTKLMDCMKELHISGQFAPNGRKGLWVEGGDPTGLYHLVVGEGQNAFVGNGLGGTSLLNANVFLRANDGVLDMNVWPKELRGKKAWKKCTFCHFLVCDGMPIFLLS